MIRRSAYEGSEVVQAVFVADGGEERCWQRVEGGCKGC